MIDDKYCHKTIDIEMCMIQKIKPKQIMINK